MVGPAMPALQTRMSIPPSASTVAATAASTIGSRVTSTATGRPAPARQFRLGLLDAGLVLVPQRHRGAGAQQPLADGAADALGTAGDDRLSPGKIDLVHARPLPEMVFRLDPRVDASAQAGPTATVSKRRRLTK